MMRASGHLRRPASDSRRLPPPPQLLASGHSIAHSACNIHACVCSVTQTMAVHMRVASVTGLTSQHCHRMSIRRPPRGRMRRSYHGPCHAVCGWLTNSMRSCNIDHSCVHAAGNTDGEHVTGAASSRLSVAARVRGAGLVLAPPMTSPKASCRWRKATVI